jgi:hypothetical protein
MEAPVVVEPVKEKKSTGTMVGAIAAIVLCGVVGLCLLCPLSFTMFFGALQDWTSSDFSGWLGLIPLCLSVIGIAVGIAVPIVLLKKKKPAEEAPADLGEPLPPAS